MDVAGTAVGIASLGIQVCQSLLDYYDKWKDYSEDITSTLQSIEQTKAALSSLQSLCEGVDGDKTKNVISAAQACREHVSKLEKKAKKLRTYEEPKGWREMLVAQLQKTWYPLRHETLGKLRKTATDIQGQLSLFLQILDLDIGKETLQRVSAQGDEVRDRIERITLQTQETRKLLESDQFREAIRWLDAADPEIDYKIARELREDGTGSMLIGSEIYSEWKQGSTRHLWIQGKAGCGKSIASATIIEDIGKYCESHSDTGYAMFYFTFNNAKKQSYGDCLQSLVSQLSDHQIAPSLLLEAYKRSKNKPPEENDMEDILILALKTFRQFYLILDALDESPEHFAGKQTIRQKLLHRLSYLSEKVANLKIIATSRPLEDIEDQITKLSSSSKIDLAEYINQDIKRYIESQLAEDSHLSLLDRSLKSEIMDKLLAKADGMFRWVYCQMQDLKTLQSTRPSRIKAVLNNLPTTLDETYNRMLERVQLISQEDALIYLRWLAYAQEPLTLAELAETIIIDVSTPEGTINMDDRGSTKDIQQLLSGLILIYSEKEEVSGDFKYDSYDSMLRGPFKKVRLAHYSVKEYLESSRILSSKLGKFHLDGPIERQNIANGCLTYLHHYAGHELATRTKTDLDLFPLLQYAAHQWYAYPDDIDTGKVVRFLRSSENIKSWTNVHQPDGYKDAAFGYHGYNAGNGIYYASYFGLSEVVEELLLDSDVNIAIGEGGPALMVATKNNHVETMKILIERDRTNVNAQPDNEYYGTALIAAAWYGHENAIKVLLANGANVNAQANHVNLGTALIAAIVGHHTEAMQILLANGADINVQARSGFYGTALIAAAANVHKEAMQMLLAKGANANVQTQYGVYGTALIAAVAQRTHTRENIQMLVEHGADVNTQTQQGRYGTALVAAVARGGENIVELLARQYGAEVNARVLCGSFDCALMAATSHSTYNSRKLMILLELGGDISTVDTNGMNVVHWIAHHGDAEAFQRVLALKKYDLGTEDRHNRTVLHFACISGELQMVELLLYQSPSLVIKDFDKMGWTFLHWACRNGSFKLLKLLNDAGCKTRIIRTEYPTASWAPLDIAIHYNNSKLITKEGNLIESYDWSLVLSSGIVQPSPTVNGSQVSAVRENQLIWRPQSTRSSVCDACNSNTVCIRCLTCRTSYSCLMCQQNFREMHPEHKWEYL